MISVSEKELCRMAAEAMKAAYSPYSECAVGAALLASSGKVYTGCNIENASFSITMCAERTALFKAVSEGERQFYAIAVAGGKNGVVAGTFPPCGACRQALSEFCPPDMPVLLVNDAGYERHLFGDLLPLSFGAEFVKQDD